MVKIAKTFTLMFFCILPAFSGVACADPSPTPVTPKKPNYLHVRTINGQSLKAQVQSFEGISLSVLETLKKQGRYAYVTEPGGNPDGNMTFVLGPDVPSLFAAWAGNQPGQDAPTGTTGYFNWVDSKGKTTYNFRMSNLRVVQFIQSKSIPNSGTLVLSADTISTLPIQFKSNNP